VPVATLVDECPLYDLDPRPPPAPLYPPPAQTLEEDDPGAILLGLLSSPNLASRRPVFEQFDCLVQSRTVRRPAQADAAVLRLPGGGALAVSIDGNGRRVACDPHAGTMEAVFEAAANLACVGAEPLGLTNCLNFGNPEKPHIAWQLERSVAGLADACRTLGVPVVGGNVSLYNEGPDGPVYPTPVVGLVGRLPDAERAGRLGFAREGDAIAVAGRSSVPDLAGSELSKLRGEPLATRLARWDEDQVAGAIAAVREAVRAGALSSAHDIAEGGLATAVAECCLAGALGARIEAPPSQDPEPNLFGEAPGRFVLSGPRATLEALRERLDVEVCGQVGGDRLTITMAPARIDLPLDSLREAHESGLSPLFR
jgi:phosphoribosylformylglycinamidine synthase subunit PurL